MSATVYHVLILLAIVVLLQHCCCQDIITTFAGVGTYIGDSGASTSAIISNPVGIALDSSGWQTYIFKLSFLLISLLYFKLQYVKQIMCILVIMRIIVSGR